MFFLFSFFVVLQCQQLTSDILNGLFSGRSTAASAWNRVGNHTYYPVPLLSSGNTIPLLDGEYGDFSADDEELYFVSGSIVAIGIEKVDSNWYLYASHDYSITERTNSPNVNADDPTFVGAFISLFVFSQDWKIVGGKNLIDNKYSATTGALITKPFGGLTSISLIQNGFYDGSVLFMSESGRGGFNSWFVDIKSGDAFRIGGCGAFNHTNTIPMSTYFPKSQNPFKNTVLITSSSYNGIGNIFMFVGSQTESNPNGLSNGTLYILYASGYSNEQLNMNEVITIEWIPIPSNISYSRSTTVLSNWIILNNRSTNFRNIGKINEDPMIEGTFFITVSGGNYPVNTNLNLTSDECLDSSIVGGCDNPLGKVYRLNISTVNPISQLSNIELVLSGSLSNGAGFIDILPTHRGEIYIAEDLNSISMNEVFIVQNRTSTVRKLINSNFNNSLEPFMELDYHTFYPYSPLFKNHMSHSSLIEVGGANDSVYMMCFQGTKINGTDILSSQITIFIQLDIDQGYNFGTPGTYEHPTFFFNPELLSALLIGWALTVLMLVALFLGDTIKPVKAEESNFGEDRNGKIVLKEFDECMNDRDNWCCGSRLGRNYIRVFTAAFLSVAGAVLAGFNPTIAGILVGGAICGIGNGASTWLAWEKKEKHFVNVRLMNDFPKVSNLATQLDEKLNYIIETLHETEKVEEVIKNTDIRKIAKENEFTFQHRFYWVLRLGRNYARLFCAGSISSAGGWLGGFLPTVGGIIGGALLGGFGNGLSTWLAYEQPYDEVTTKRALKDLPKLHTISNENDTRMNSIIDQLRILKSDIQLIFP